MDAQENIFVNQYCDMALQWERNNITIDTASERQIEQMKKLQADALKQSGLTLNELTLIMLCRNHRIFKAVNTYARKLIR